MDCKTIAEDKNKIFYTYFNCLGLEKVDPIRML